MFTTDEDIKRSFGDLINQSIYKTYGFTVDDFADLQCLLEAGVSYCPKNSIIDLFVNKDFERIKRTNLESGKGCVREVIEKILTI